MTRRRRVPRALNLLRKLIEVRDDLLSKGDDRKATISQQNLAHQMEAEMVQSLAAVSEEHAHLVENLQQIEEKLVNEEFLYVSLESDLVDVNNFQRMRRYRGGVKIVANSAERRELVKRIAIAYRLRVIE